MSITPFETLAVAPKSQEASVYRANQLQKEAGQQLHIAGMVQQKAEKKLERAEKTSQNDETAFRFDAKEKGNNAYYQQEKKDRKKKEEELNEERKRMLGCTFDITI